MRRDTSSNALRPNRERLRVRRPRHVRTGCVWLAFACAIAHAHQAPAQTTPATRLGPPDAIVRYGFTKVLAVRELADDVVLVSDVGENRLLAARWNSGEVRQVGSIGQGPGEYRRVGWLYPLSADSTLFTDLEDGRWIVMAGTSIVDTYGRGHPIAGRLGADLAGTDRHGHVLKEERNPTADVLLLRLVDRASGEGNDVARLRGYGRTGVAVVGAPGGRPTSLVTNPMRSRDHALLFPDGWIAIVRVDDYRTVWRSPDGREVTGPPLPFQRIEVSDAEMLAAMAREGLPASIRPSQIGGWPRWVPPVREGFTSPTVVPAPDGSLIVARTPSRSTPANSYDVVDRGGRKLGMITLSQGETIVGSGARGVYVVRTDEVGLQTLSRHPWVRD